MELQTLKVATRQSQGKGKARKVRAAGSLPGVLYGGDREPVSLSVNLRAFEALIHHARGGEHALVQLEVEDNAALNTPAIVKAVQHHPLRNTPTHADFLRIRLDEKITTVIPIRLVGQAPGIAEGGVLDHQLRELEIECLALSVPDEVVVDVSGLHVNDSLHVSDLQVPPDVEIISDPERPVVAVHPPRVVKETAEAGEAAEGEAASPEVITERKEKEEKDAKDAKESKESKKK
ncbi:MAG TPA: 50S ribosomal protein L25 [Candidatus Hydrogenedentes bacterium]|nr:50S ribosomal protein L25 [Candidatus Hydrogenedentota bacterium]HOV73713.1 50S ribosomal protein L25 [Candidatus Hydrogenedentota bacterium]HPC17106.1 50S ribosomal protein L25 [Candidatus Hydrogenedentota bacterium]HRT20511.1 50S ribosomal protein L25 [Candidatus Hydrogenedentota bacterium]HRT65284.1 50S ribosomal protein L25 [Candidatus Hydrogenedentota bacterium]